MDRALNKRRQPVRHTGQFRSRRGMMREHVLLLKHAAATQEFCAPSSADLQADAYPISSADADHCPYSPYWCKNNGREVLRFFRPAMDRTVLLSSVSLQKADNYCATALQELVHWTGAIPRLNRFHPRPFRIGELCI